MRELDRALPEPLFPRGGPGRGRRRVVDPDEAIRLYQQGLTNFEIAEMRTLELVVETARKVRG